MYTVMQVYQMEKDMYYKRKAYDKLIDWKKNYADDYAALLEGARRVGKSTIAEEFAKNEYKSYIMLDFSRVSNNIKKIFDDIGNLDMFFLRLQAETGIMQIATQIGRCGQVNRSELATISGRC